VHRHSAPVWPKRVVVLGASGFVGKNLVHHLTAAGTSTVALSSADIDLCDPESVGKLETTVEEDDALVFVSALTPDKGRDVGTMMKNLKMGENVCAFLRNNKNSCSHVVYISSDAVYADGISLVQEASCASPASLHGLMHLARERMLCHTLMNTGVPLLILRPSLLYGPGDTHNSYGPNRFLRSAREGSKVVLFGNGEEKRDHVFVEDLSRLLGLCLTHRSEGVLNVATGVSTSFFDVAEIITEMYRDGVVTECLPRQHPISHRHFDTGAALKLFPFFHYTSLATGLFETLVSTTGK
jgi:nucleoside-diphosphate-sugar epimerase